MDRKRMLVFAALTVIFALVCLTGCVIPGMGLDDSSLLPVPRRVNYAINSDPFYPRTDILVYKCKKDGSMVLVPISNLDRVGIITAPSEEPDEADFVDEWLDAATGSFIFPAVGRYDVVVSYNNGTMNGRYSVWAQDPYNIGSGGGGGGGGGGGNGGGVGIIWGN